MAEFGGLASSRRSWLYKQRYEQRLFFFVFFNFPTRQDLSLSLSVRIAPPFMEATDASRLVCVVVVSYQEYSLTHSLQEISLCLRHFFRS